MKKNILTEIRTKFDEKILEIRFQNKILKRIQKLVTILHCQSKVFLGFFFFYNIKSGFTSAEFIRNKKR